MDQASSGFILGYHGCDAETAEAVFSGESSLKPSKNDYDWLGDGVYFWEYNARRAYDFAVEMSRRPHPSGQKIKSPAVVGAIIDLGFCLNLLDTRFIQLVKAAYEETVVLYEAMDKTSPKNSGGPDLVNRKLDCLVLRVLHQTRSDQKLQAFDSVRAAFFEGDRLYDNAGFSAKNHIQVCVRDTSRIVGYFRPLDEKGRPLKFDD